MQHLANCSSHGCRCSQDVFFGLYTDDNPEDTVLRCISWFFLAMFVCIFIYIVLNICILIVEDAYFLTARCLDRATIPPANANRMMSALLLQESSCVGQQCRDRCGQQRSCRQYCRGGAFGAQQQLLPYD